MKKIILFLIVVFLPAAMPGTAGAWRSVLYPVEWTPPAASVRFYSDKIIQDFSYAGYACGEEPLPAVSGPVFDVTDYGARKDDSGDSRAAIQAAIDAAGSAGGGVVYLPAGTYRLSKSGSNCLRISKDGVVLRGDGPTRTFLYCTDPNMRQSVIIRFEPAAAESKSGSVALSQDIDGPATRLYLENADSFSVGDRVLLEWDFTYDWIAEHGQLSYWNPNTSLGVPAAGNMRRIITAVDQSEKWIRIDAPTRYSMKTRDSARVSRISGQLRECGVEDLAIGSVMNTMAGWAENDYTDSSKGAYYTHDSYALRFKFGENCWAARVRTFSPGNENGSHIPSNGLNLVSSRFITVRECVFSKPQYGGGGGNGYMYRLQNAGECLVADCVADFSRHGIVVSQSGTNGNVFLRCTDKDTGRQCGLDGSDLTNGNCSDNHMHFSHSNLYDNCRAVNSGYEALHRTFWGTIAHALTAAHTVYWNTYGENATGGSVVKSQQGRYGYIIGTRGPSSAVSTPTGNGTSPEDHQEGVGLGETLQPESLFADQVALRTGNQPPRFTTSAAALDIAVNGSGEMTIEAVDDDGDPLYWTIGAAQSGGIEIVDADDAQYHLRYTPAPDYVGRDAFTVTVSDGLNGYYSALTVDIRVYDENQSGSGSGGGGGCLIQTAGSRWIW